MPIGAGLGALLGAGVLGGASIFGASQSAGAATQAAKIQAAAANNAVDLQRGVYTQIQNNLAPYQASGANAAQDLWGSLNTASGGVFRNPLDYLGSPQQYSMPDFTAQMYHQTPGYAASLQGGGQAIQNAGAGRGGALSGNVLKALMGQGVNAANLDFTNERANFQGVYDATFNANNTNFWNQYNAGNQQNTNKFTWLDQLLGQGQAAAAGQGGLGLTAASNAGNALIGAGNAQAAGIVGANNAQVGGINSLATLLAGPNTGSNNGSLLASILGGFGGGGGFPAAGAGQSGDFSGGIGLNSQASFF